MREKINITCKLAGIEANGLGYSLFTSDEANQILRGCYPSYESQCRAKAPYNEVNFTFEVDNQSAAALHTAILREFGTDETISEIINEDMLQGWPELLIEIRPNYVIMLEDESIKLSFIIEKYNLSAINAYLIMVLGRGEFLRKDSFRFYIPSGEGNKHNRPHVHVETSDFRQGSVDIMTLEQNKGGKLKKHEMTKIRKILEGKQPELLEAWNDWSGGIQVNVDILLGQASIKGR